MHKQHMDSKECANYIGVHVNTIRRYVHEEGLPVLRFPGRSKWVFRKDLVDAWVYERSQPTIINKPKASEARNEGRGKLRVIMPHQ